MKKFRLALMVGAMAGAAMLAAGTAQAMPLSGQLAPAAANLSPIVKAQFLFGGRQYCFYPDGWHGPGWYWCGYGARYGFGFGGPEGWHGWHRGGRGPMRGPMRGGPMHGGPMHGGPMHGGPMHGGPMHGGPMHGGHGGHRH